MALDLQTVLIAIIILITINLLFVGFYIVKVLRDVSKAVRRAHEVIDDVDQSVKDGIEKVKAMERPLEALSATTQALSGAMKTIGSVGKNAMSILGGTPKKDITIPSAAADDNIDDRQDLGEHQHKEVTTLLDDTNIGDSEETAEENLTKKKGSFLRPKFFK